MGWRSRFASGGVLCVTCAIVVAGVVTITTEMAVTIVIAIVSIVALTIVMVSLCPHVVTPSPPTPPPGMGLGRVDTSGGVPFQLVDCSQHGIIQSHGYPSVPFSWVHGHAMRALMSGIATYQGEGGESE